MMNMDKWILNLTRRFSKQAITTTPSEVKPAPVSEQVNNTEGFMSSDSESEAEQDDDVAPKDVHLAVGEKQPVFRTSSAEKRRYCESKRSTSSSSSCSSDDELKELRDVSSLSGQRTHVRHKPPLKDRRIVSLATSKEAMFDSQDDDDVFTQNKSSSPLKRTKFTHRQPLSGRYTDFDKMRRTPLTQVPKARKVWRRELPSSCNNFARMGPVPIFPTPCSPIEVGHQSFHSIAQT